MALYIVSADGREREWHIGETAPLPYEKMKDVEEIQADGHELERIKQVFAVTKIVCHELSWPRHEVIGYSIPVPSTASARWFGDIARTICANIF